MVPLDRGLGKVGAPEPVLNASVRGRAGAAEAKHASRDAMGEEADGRQRRRRWSASYDDEAWPQDGYPVRRRLELAHDDHGESSARHEHVVALPRRFVVWLAARDARLCIPLSLRPG